MKGLLGMAKLKKEQEILKGPPASMFQPGKRLPYQPQDDYEDQGEIMDEDMDEDYQPSQQEILQYAAFLGIDPMREKDLMYIAKEGLIAPLPPQWKPFQTKTKQIYYVNLQTGEKIWEHPCDEYYQQLVIKERAKKLNKEIDNKSKAREMKNENKPLGIEIKPKPKPADPLLKLEQQKKMKKLEQQKRAEYERKKADLDRQYQNKKDDISKTNRSKEETLRNRYNKEQDELASSNRQKISEKQRSQQSKFESELESFRTQLKQSLESTYAIRLKAQRQTLEQSYKSKKQQARRNLQTQFKKKKKVMEEQFSQSMKALEEKQKELKKSIQIKQDNFDKQIQKLKQKHIEDKIAQNSHILDTQRARQENIYNAEVQKLMEQHNKKIASIQKQTTSTANTISLEPFVKQLEENYQKQIAALQFELKGIKQLRQTQMQQKIAEFQVKLEQAHRDRLEVILRDSNKKMLRQKEKAEREFELKVSNIEKKANDDYIRSLNAFEDNFEKEQGVLLEHYQHERLLKNDQQSNQQEQLNRLNKQLQRLQDQSVRYKKILSNLELQCQNSKSHLEREQAEKGQLYTKLNAQQKDLYDLIGDKQRTNFRKQKDLEIAEL